MNRTLWTNYWRNLACKKTALKGVTDLSSQDIQGLFTKEFLEELFPPHRADEFFDALYGGAEEGAFDIGLSFVEYDPHSRALYLEFVLTERPGKCMACSLTYGLPPVFERHPIIDLKGMLEKISARLPQGLKVDRWELGPTTPKAPKVNVIPLTIILTQA